MAAEKIDPVEIIARVGGANPDIGGSRRAFEVWISLATKAGWSVDVDSGYVPSADTECGAVDIEGLRYLVKYDRRVRRTLFDDSTGSVVARPIFAYAAWAEPVVFPEK